MVSRAVRCGSVHCFCGGHSAPHKLHACATLRQGPPLRLLAIPPLLPGLAKLFEMKDNHIFRGLAALAAYGMSLEAATATGKDVVQVGSARNVGCAC